MPHPRVSLPAVMRWSLASARLREGDTPASPQPQGPPVLPPVCGSSEHHVASPDPEQEAVGRLT